MNWIGANLGTLVLICLVLICPVSMMWMMRGKNKAADANDRATTRGRLLEDRTGDHTDDRIDSADPPPRYSGHKDGAP